MTHSVSDLLVTGLYSTRDAALYARVRTNTMNRWIYGDHSGESVFDPELQTDDKVVTFLDFVQALAIKRIRQERKIPLSKIRTAFVKARDEYGASHPLALDHTLIGLFGPPNDTSKQEIWICLEPDDDDARKYFQLTGKQHGNQLIGEVIRTYTHRLTYDKSGLANRFTIFNPKDSGEVIMDPLLRFGEPFMKSCGYTARTLFDAYIAEGSVQHTADIYGVDPKEIELAVEFFDYLNPPTAARHQFDSFSTR